MKMLIKLLLGAAHIKNRRTGKMQMRYAVIALLLATTSAFADTEHRTIIDGRAVKTTDGSPIIIDPFLEITSDDCFIGPLTIANSKREIALIVPDGMMVPDGCDPR